MEGRPVAPRVVVAGAPGSHTEAVVRMITDMTQTKHVTTAGLAREALAAGSKLAQKLKALQAGGSNAVADPTIDGLTTGALHSLQFCVEHPTRFAYSCNTGCRAGCRRARARALRSQWLLAGRVPAHCRPGEAQIEQSKI